jgi:hypothetical protein
MERDLKARGSGFALIEDAVKACLRLAADDSVNGKSRPWTSHEPSVLTTTGRALGIVPHYVDKEGYIDVALDDLDREDVKWMWSFNGR